MSSEPERTYLAEAQSLRDAITDLSDAAAEEAVRLAVRLGWWHQQNATGPLADALRTYERLQGKRASFRESGLDMAHAEAALRQAQGAGLWWSRPGPVGSERQRKLGDRIRSYAGRVMPRWPPPVVHQTMGDLEPHGPEHIHPAAFLEAHAKAFDCRLV